MKTGEILQREFDPFIANFKPDKRVAYLRLFFYWTPQFPGYAEYKLKALVLGAFDVPV